MITIKKNYALCEREVDESHKYKKHGRDRDGNRENCDRLNRPLFTLFSERVGIIVSLSQKSFVELSIF
jgi:hypothetical protein